MSNQTNLQDLPFLFPRKCIHPTNCCSLSNLYHQPWLSTETQNAYLIALPIYLIAKTELFLWQNSTFRPKPICLPHIHIFILWKFTRKGINLSLGFSLYIALVNVVDIFMRFRKEKVNTARVQGRMKRERRPTTEQPISEETDLMVQNKNSS